MHVQNLDFDNFKGLLLYVKNMVHSCSTLEKCMYKSPISYACDRSKAYE